MVIDVNAPDKPSITTDLTSVPTVRPPLLLFLPIAETYPTALKPDTTLKQSYHVVSLTDFKQVPREITPFSSEPLGMLSELRSWNDVFGERKREKQKAIWGEEVLGCWGGEVG